MVSKKDGAVTKGVLIEVLTAALKEQDVRFDQKIDDLKVNLRDEIHSTETRMINRLEKRLNEVKVEIIDGFTDVLDEFVFPQILELQTNMARVKNRLQMT